MVAWTQHRQCHHLRSHYDVRVWAQSLYLPLAPSGCLSQDALIPSYPKLEDDSEHCYRRTELELLL